MGYAFPNAPAIGDSANGYVWDGERWGSGGAISGGMVEQFFDLSGKTLQTIPIPSWAVGVSFSGAAFCDVNGYVAMTVSADGTTFFNGASDYYYAGPTHATGSGLYQTLGATANSVMLITASGNTVAFPHVFDGTMWLTRPDTGSVFDCKVYSKSVDNQAAYLHRTVWLHSWPSTTVTTALALKALRFSNPSGVAWRAGSKLVVKWLGAVNAVNAVNNPALHSCAITCNASQTINSAAFNKVDAALNLVSHDPSGMWDNTLKRIIPKRPGLYLFEGLVSIESVSDAARMVVGVYKNGVLEALLGRGTAGATGIAGFGGAVLLKANGTTDYFELFAYHNSGSAQLIQGTIAGGYNGYTHFGATFIGNDTPSNAVIDDAPSDGGEYVRVNGVWRKKSQSLNFTGVSQIDVPVPPGAQRVRWDGAVLNSTTAAQYMALRVSVDGTTFLSGASDYSYAGWSHYTNVTPTAVVNFPVTPQSHTFLHLSGNDTTIPQVMEGALTLARPTTLNVLGGRINCFNYSTSNHYQNAQIEHWANVGSALAIKALRFYNSASVVWSSGTLNLDWGY